MQSSRPPVTVIVPTGDREDVIEDCLQSAAWAEELIVVDSFSTDRTLEIAQRYATRILRHEYGYSALQKNWAIPQASHEWVMILDTDERITSNLRQEIDDVLAAAPEAVGYRIPRLNLSLGKPILRAGYHPDYQVRLFKRDHGRYSPRRVHAHVVLDGPCGVLANPIVHYAHRSLDQTISNLLVRMTAWESDERRQAQANHPTLLGGIVPGLLIRPPVAFLLRYVGQAGWRDGMHGFSLSLLWSMYVALTYLRTWESTLQLPPLWWVEDWHTRSKALESAHPLRPQQPRHLR
jgi:glycosyltransferase involved in cell wall biosynthesis